VRIVRGYPPNYAEIRERLSPSPRAVFAYGDVIYSPSGRAVSLDLVVHEEVHSRQQELVGGPESWWRRYIDDPAFRLEQEVEAYRAQYRVASSRSERRYLLLHICRDLSSRMYGNLVTSAEARALVLAEA
jgi:hypothetical protein